MKRVRDMLHQKGGRRRSRCAVPGEALIQNQAEGIGTSEMKQSIQGYHGSERAGLPLLLRQYLQLTEACDPATPTVIHPRYINSPSLFVIFSSKRMKLLFQPPPPVPSSASRTLPLSASLTFRALAPKFPPRTHLNCPCSFVRTLFRLIDDSFRLPDTDEQLAMRS